jgi:DNA invertase Pin-like site-specific DNA recombinase
VSTEQQHLTAQRNSLPHSVVGDERIYVDRDLTGTNRDRPGLRLASAACHSGDTLVVTKLDRVARSLPTLATSSTNSPAATSSSFWAGPCTTQPIRLAGCC